MASVYFKNRVEAGKQLLAQSQLSRQDGAVISISTDAALVASQIAQALTCPLQLYLEEVISIPGGLDVGSVSQDGKFQYASNISTGHQEYFYSEFRGYIEESKRQSFSSLNRELKGRQTLRNDLLNNKHITIVTDCLENLVPINSLIQTLKSVRYKSINVCAAIAMSNDLSNIKQLCDNSIVIGSVDFFYGADHYFEDNTVIPREKVIEAVSETLRLWPVAT